MGYPYSEIEKYADSFKKGDVIIEIGGDRGEGSSAFLKEFAQRYGLEFHSIDIDARVYGNMRLYEGVHTHGADGAEWLKGFDKKIKFAYLDNYYWLFSPESPGANLEVLKTIYDMKPKTNNRDSRKAHLDQAKALDKLADKPCFVIFDDTWKTPRGWDGKGGTAAPWLLKHGWKAINKPIVGESVDAYVFMRKG